MRIDSAVTVGNDVVLYPFRSPRGPYAPFYPAVYLDTNGGSWLGKQITVRPDGTNLFDTYWGDTVFINTSAVVGTSWIFYNDTSVRYYQATIVGDDTMTVLGVLDSIKTITLTAYDAQGVNVSDMAHNKQIVFSKDHGLVRTFSLYMFPFHPPHLQAYTHNQDFLLDRVETSFGSLNSFELVDYHHPTAVEIFDFNVGDVFEFSGYNGQLPYYRLDSIKTKNIISPTQVSYIMTRTTSDYYYGPPMPYWTYSHDTITFSAYATPNIGSRMPEEWYAGRFISYDPDDSSSCVKSYKYGYLPSYVYGDGRVNTFEPCDESYVFKAGFGRVNFMYCADPSPGASGNIVENLVFSVKNGVPCGNFHPIINSIDDEMQVSAGLSVYPMPASDVLHVVYSGSYLFRLSDLVGKVVASGAAKNMADIPVNILPNGFYMLHVVDKSNNKRTIRKVLVQH